MCLHFKGVTAYAKCPRDVVGPCQLHSCRAAQESEENLELTEKHVNWTSLSLITRIIFYSAVWLANSITSEPDNLREIQFSAFLCSLKPFI